MKSKFLSGVATLYNAVGMRSTAHFLRDDLASRNSLFEGVSYEASATKDMGRALFEDVKRVKNLLKGKTTQTPTRDTETITRNDLDEGPN